MTPTSAKNTKFVPLAIATAVILTLVVVTLVMRNRSLAVTEDDRAAPVAADVGVPGDSIEAAGKVAARAPSAPRTRLPVDSQAIALQQLERSRENKKKATEKSAQLRQTVTAKFNAEKVDAAWAPGKEVDLEKISSLPQITSSVAAPKNMTVDCRSSMCRINGSFDSGGKAEDWIMLYMASAGGALPNAVVSRVPNADGTTTVQIYGRGR